LKEPLAAEGHSGHELEEEIPQVFRRRKRFEQTGQVGQDKGRNFPPERVKKFHPRGNRVEGGKDFLIGVIGKRRKDFDLKRRREGREEISDLILKPGEGPGGGLDKDHPLFDLPGQAGKKIGQRWFVDPCNPEASFPQTDVLEQALESVGFFEKIETHDL